MPELEEHIYQLFIATDQQDWNGVKASFAENVTLDYSSMNGQAAATLSPEQIIADWQGILPGFEHTHHQLGNMIARISGTQATVFCYGTATHYLEDDHGNVWTVVGTYDFTLEKNTADNAWKVTTMKFMFKYQEGNTALPEKAMQRVRSSQQA